MWSVVLDLASQQVVRKECVSNGHHWFLGREEATLHFFFGDTLTNGSIQGNPKNYSYESILRCGNPK